MVRSFLQVFSDGTGAVRRQALAMLLILVLANLMVWLAALAAFHEFPLLLGTSVLAYTFGLRHAVDADHIAAIDSVTRKLMQQGQRPVSVGFFFSLGHSTIVVLASLAIALTATTIKSRFPTFQEIGGLIGTSVSAAFLFFIAVINLVVLVDVLRMFREVRRGAVSDDASLDDLLDQRGLLGRFFRPLFKLISRSWHMYPLGFLFGLGFDTATEIALLGISATQASSGLPTWSIMLFPALFTAGMSLIDSADGILMLGAYGWASIKPVRRLYYNAAMTFVSVLVAVMVGGVEVLGVVSERLGLSGGFWNYVGELTDNFGRIGLLTVAIFLGSWLLSMLIYKLKKYDDLEVVADGD